MSRPVWRIAAVGLVTLGCGGSRTPEPGRGAGPPEKPIAVAATSREPAVAARQERVVYGVSWGMSYEAARERAGVDGRPILLHFAGIFTPASRLMERRVLPRPEVATRLARFETVRLDIDLVPIRSLTHEQREGLAGANDELLSELTGDRTTPFFVVLNPDGTVRAKLGGNCTPEAFAAFLDRALAEKGGL